MATGGNAIFSMPGTSNNAPQPIPNSYNPSGNTNPNPSSPTTPSANAGIFGSAPSSPTTGAPGVGGLSSGFNFPSGYGAGSGDQFYKQLSSTYGSGTAGLLWSILQGGLFNPQIADSFLNSMQPGVNRGTAAIQNSFGAEGSRFGSAAALGEGDYLSQVNLNEQQTLSQMFLTDQGEQLNLLQNLLPTLHSEQSNKGGILSDIVGGLEIAGGVALDVASGGALTPATIPLIAGGASTIAGQGKGGGSSTQQPMMAPIYQAPTTTPPFSPTNNSVNTVNVNALNGITAQATAGAALGGVNNPADTTDNPWSEIIPWQN